VISLSYSKIDSLKELKNKVLFSSKVSSLLHTLQIERGLSAAYSTNKNDQFKKELLLQRDITDHKIKEIKKVLYYLRAGTSVDGDAKRLLTRLAQLQAVREEIDNHFVLYGGIIKFYSRINAALLDILITISKESHLPEVTQQILAYTHLLYLKENMGKERAEGVTIYSNKSLERDSLLKFAALLSLEKYHESMFLKFTSKKMQNIYLDKKDKTIFTAIADMRHTILYDDVAIAGIYPKVWFNTLTQALNTLGDIATILEKETISHIKNELVSLNNIFIFLTILILTSLIVFILMLVAFFKLAREEQRLRIVMDKYIISSTTDLKGKIIDVSEAFCTISGYTKEELIGKPHNMVRHPDTPAETFKIMWQRIKKGDAWKGKVKNRRKDGGFYWVYANVEPLYATNGTIDAYVSIRLDITESELLLLKVKEEERKNKFQEEMIREQSRLAQMGEMISMIAHQWRQPLSAIAAASGSLHLKAKRNKLDQDTAIEIADKIKGFSLHLSATIDDFRNFFKTNKTQTVTDFKKVFNAVYDIIEGSLEKNRITLDLKIESADSFETYENELKQVVLNLLKNAEDALIEHEIEKPKIEIYINNNEFTICDNAGGIPKDIIEKIFDPYFSTKTKKDGTGLGLYMSKMIIEDHCNGQMNVSNEESGAKFQIILGEKK
jgi:PAS domain S-box-containing protein